MNSLRFGMFCRTTSSKHHSEFPKFIQVACSLAECKVARAPCWLEGSINQEQLNQFLKRCISKSLPVAFRLPKRCWTRQIWSQNTATVEVRQLPNIWKPFDHPNWFQSSFQGTKNPAPPVAGPAATRQRTRTPSHPCDPCRTQRRINGAEGPVRWWDPWWLNIPLISMDWF